MSKPSPHANRAEGSLDLWQKLTRVVMVLLVVALLVLGVLVFWPQLRKQEGLKAEVAALQVTRDALLVEREHLEKKIQWVRTDDWFLEMQARERLGMAKEGEFVIRIKE